MTKHHGDPMTLATQMARSVATAVQSIATVRQVNCQNVLLAQLAWPAVATACVFNYWTFLFLATSYGANTRLCLFCDLG